VVDLGDPACVERIDALQMVLREKRVTLTGRWARKDAVREADEVDEDPFALQLPVGLLANKADLLADVENELRAFLELTGICYPAFAVSASTGQGLGEIGSLLFRQLGIVRVYTKAPGRPAERDRPFTLRRGQTVEDIARLVHRDLARSLKYARVWGQSGFDGQHVGRDHLLADGDVVELHG
jgi:ribosome-interacting GTPase 1